MPKLRAFLDKSSLDRAHSLLCNPGLLLRWFCSLDCLETYARLSKPLIPSDTHINSDLFIDPGTYMLFIEF